MSQLLSIDIEPHEPNALIVDVENNLTQNTIAHMKALNLCNIKWLQQNTTCFHLFPSLLFVAAVVNLKRNWIF